MDMLQTGRTIRQIVQFVKHRDGFLSLALTHFNRSIPNFEDRCISCPTSHFCPSLIALDSKERPMKAREG